MKNKSESKDSKVKMTEEEKRDFDELYQYVRSKIMMYDENQALSSQMVLRLKGLTKGKLMYNKKQKDRANYSYKVVLYTFKICRANIMKSIAYKTFSNDFNKFIYICAIIENNINDVYERVNKVKATNEKTSNLNIDNLVHKTAKYKKGTKKNRNKELDNLW